MCGIPYRQRPTSDSNSSSTTTTAEPHLQHASARGLCKFVCLGGGRRERSGSGERHQQEGRDGAHVQYSAGHKGHPEAAVPLLLT